MSFNKITSKDREGKGVSGLPNTPNLTPTQLQEQFDSLANLAIEKFNEFITALEAASAAGNIGSANGTVQTDLTALRQGVTSAYQRISNVETRIKTAEESLENHINTYYIVDCIPSKLLNFEKRITGLEIQSGVSGDGSGVNSSGFMQLSENVDKLSDKYNSLDNEVYALKDRVNITENELLGHVCYLTNVKVSKGDWESDATYTDFPYKAKIEFDGVDADYMATVTFGVEQALSGMFAPIAETIEHYIVIYANAIPDSDITIPTIQLIRGCSL